MPDGRQTGGRLTLSLETMPAFGESFTLGKTVATMGERAYIKRSRRG